MLMFDQLRDELEVIEKKDDWAYRFIEKMVTRTEENVAPFAGAWIETYEVLLKYVIRRLDYVCSCCRGVLLFAVFYTH